MKQTNKKSLIQFEKHLRQAVNEQPKIPFSTEEVLCILKNYNPPDNLEDLKDESIIGIMKDEFAKRKEQERKVKNPSLINSLGELIRTYCDYRNISPIRLAKLIGLSKDEFENYENNRINPESYNTNTLLNLMMLIGIPIQELINILEKTATLFRIRQDTTIAPSYARMKKGLKNKSKMQVQDSAMNELFLTLHDQDEDNTEKLEQLKTDLMNEYKKIQAEHEPVGQCFTINTRQRKEKINTIVRQL